MISTTTGIIHPRCTLKLSLWMLVLLVIALGDAETLLQDELLKERQDVSLKKYLGMAEIAEAGDANVFDDIHTPRDLQQYDHTFGGKLYDRCSIIFPCDEGLQCTGIPTQKLCLPVDCLMEGVRAELDANGLEADFATVLLEQAGLTEESMFNRSTIDMGDNATEEMTQKWLLMPGVEQKLRDAMASLPLDLRRLDEMAAACTSGAQPSPNQISGQPWTYLGLNLEVSAGFKFIYQFIYSSQLEISTDPLIVATWSNICIGGGPSAGFHTEFIVGWNFGAQNITEVAQNSVMFDYGGAFFVGLGQALGFTVDPCYFRLDIMVGVGIGAGISATYCFVTGYSEIV
ncbi:expressed unknown protein [Seminavis robusta]|uniref:Uncharacterized protein n=1 Tax=Seminavis robusta TaxID=568900 RepID=A0A9N8HI52_9STRA|nr:expressed unknown protein [Seminavis robusta]|eukprot:Sro603_g173890.1 n/a (344) ;mRNA; f:12384-13523